MCEKPVQPKTKQIARAFSYQGPLIRGRAKNKAVGFDSWQEAKLQLQSSRIYKEERGGIF